MCRSLTLRALPGACGWLGEQMHDIVHGDASALKDVDLDPMPASEEVEEEPAPRLDTPERLRRRLAQVGGSFVSTPGEDLRRPCRNQNRAAWGAPGRHHHQARGCSSSRSNDRAQRAGMASRSPHLSRCGSVTASELACRQLAGPRARVHWVEGSLKVVRHI